MAYAGAEELELAEAEEHAEEQPAQRERHGGRRWADGAQAWQRRGARQQQREEARLEEQAVPRVVQVRDEVEADHHAPGPEPHPDTDPPAPDPDQTLKPQNPKTLKP